MSERPSFLNQPAALVERDRELQQELRTQASEAGVVLSKDSRRLDFIERSIEATEKGLKETDKAGRAALKERLTFLREERARLL